jgi:flagellar biosynthesis protein FlhF
VGKTTTIAKLAAQYGLRMQKRVGLITIDTYRIAAVDQLRTYAEILNVPLKVVLSPTELGAALEELRDCDLVLVDTAGRSQNDAIRLNELRRFLTQAKADEIHLVLSTTNSQANLVQSAERFCKLGVDRIIFTKLDEAVGFGVILNVLRRVDRKLSYLTNGQEVPEHLEVGCSIAVADLITGPPPATRTARTA